MDTGEMSEDIKSKFPWDSKTEYSALCLNNTECMNMGSWACCLRKSV